MNRPTHNAIINPVNLPIPADDMPGPSANANPQPAPVLHPAFITPIEGGLKNDERPLLVPVARPRLNAVINPVNRPIPADDMPGPSANANPPPAPVLHPAFITPVEGGLKNYERPLLVPAARPRLNAVINPVNRPIPADDMPGPSANANPPPAPVLHPAFITPVEGGLKNYERPLLVPAARPRLNAVINPVNRPIPADDMPGPSANANPQPAPVLHPAFITPIEGGLKNDERPLLVPVARPRLNAVINPVNRPIPADDMPGPSANANPPPAPVLHPAFITPVEGGLKNYERPLLVPAARPRLNAVINPVNRPIPADDMPGPSAKANPQPAPILHPAPALPTVVRDIEMELAQVLEVYPDADPLWIRFMMKVERKSINNVLDRLIRGDGVFGTGFVPPYPINEPNWNVPAIEPLNNVNGADNNQQHRNNNAQPPQRPVANPLEIVLDVFGNDLDHNWIKVQLRSLSHVELIDRIFNKELTPKRKPRKSQNSSFGSPMGGSDGGEECGVDGADHFCGNVYGADVNSIFDDATFFNPNDVDTVMNEMLNAFDPAYRAINRQPLSITSSLLLRYEFPFLYVNNIDATLRLVDGWCAPAYVLLAKAQDQLIASNKWPAMKGGKLRFIANDIKVFDQTFPHVLLNVLNCKRQMDRPAIDPGLERSVELAKLFPACTEAYEKLVEERKEARNNQVPLDCPICCDSVIVDECVHCCGGHLVCLSCFASYVEEKASGQGSSDLVCLTNEDDCQLTYSDGTLKRLSRKLYMRYAKRVRREQLAIAYGEEDGLEQCPRCGSQVEINVPPEVDRVLDCVVCKRQTCRICNEPWDEFHFGKKCTELEKDEETKKRKKYEEMMTKAAVRACHKCKQDIIKEDGCNRITCRCLATFCYLCRAENIEYDHFCRHFIEVKGAPCPAACGKCRLFEDPKAKDHEKLVEIQQQAKVDVGGNKVIGVDLSKTAVNKV